MTKSRTRVVSFRVDIPQYIEILTQAEKKDMAIDHYCKDKLTSTGPDPETVKKLKASDRKIEKLEKELSEAKKNLTSERSSHTKTKKKVTELQADVKELNREYDACSDIINQYREKFGEL